MIFDDDEEWKIMATEREAFSDAGQTGPEPRVATRDINDARRGDGVGQLPRAGESVFVKRSDEDLVLVVKGAIYPPDLAELPTLPAEMIDGVWQPAAKPAGRARGASTPRD